jgi:hypothetical protein
VPAEHLDASPALQALAYADGSRPDWAEAFTRWTCAAMVEGVREPLLAAGLVTTERFDEALRALGAGCRIRWRLLLNLLQGCGGGGISRQSFREPFLIAF